MNTRTPLRARLSSVLKPSVQPGRLILALKTALAAGIAWPVGHLLPNVDEYSYYAPLGALIVMMPTLMSSLRSTFQTVLGLILGVLLAWAVILSPLPGAVSVALAVGLGVLIGGLGGLGSGRDYVPIAALFVLVLGGADAEDYSIGYLLQMGIGMLVGVVVNATVMPPLWLRESSASVADLRRRFADTLGEVAARVHEGADLTPSIELVRELDTALRDAESLARDAADSRRLNPRARRHPYDIDEDFDDLLTLRRLAGQLRNLIDDIHWSAPRAGGGAEMAGAIESVLRHVAELVRAWDSGEGTELAAEQARSAIAALVEIERSSADATLEGGDPVLGPDARHMVALVERRLRRPK